MALTLLPDEILENIVEDVIPEGFEGLALTCNKFNSLCVPFLSRHNHRRTRFHNFVYYKFTDAFPIRTAFDVIARIAVDPVTARYIHNPDFSHDSRFMVPQALPSNPDLRPNFQIHSELDSVVPFHDLLASSPYLTAAGLDWEEYWTVIDADLGSRSYSQHAAAFLFTLLPNIKTLSLPRSWMALKTTDKLMDTTISKAKQPHHPANRPSLAQLTSLRTEHERGWTFHTDLTLVTPFLALPSLRSFHGMSCVATSPSDYTTTARDLYHKNLRSETMEVVHLEASCIDVAGIATFLSHLPRLRSLRYSHCFKYETPDVWDICAFITAICAAVGPYLEELSVSIHHVRAVAPGQVSMRQFQRLRKLEFPLDVAVCNFLNDAEVKPDLLAALVPPTVTHLSIISSGIEAHIPALESMFHDFAAKKVQTVPHLQGLHLLSPEIPTASELYQGVCERVKEECERAGVVCVLEEPENGPKITWMDV